MIMDYEKKLALAKEALDSGSYDKETIEYIFPELKENEDDEIRKWLIRTLKSLNSSPVQIDGAYKMMLPAITWLEKQDEKEINLVEILKHYPRETELYSPLYGKLWLANVDKEHEIITCYRHSLDEGCTRAILDQEDIVSFYSNGTTGLPDFSVSKDCMLFLYDIEKSGEQSLIGQREECKDCQMNYAGECKGFCQTKMNEQKETKGNDMEIPNSAWSEEDEQIALSIEQVMNCASLLNIVPEKIDKIRTWLKSLEDKVLPRSKQEWSEEDEYTLEGIIDEIKANKNNAPDYDLVAYDRFLTWLKSIKDRVQSKSKPAWDEQDEKIHSRIYDLIHAAASANYDVDEDGKELGEYAKITDWFNFLKDRYAWKPSDKQMENLSRAVNGGTYRTSLLMELYQDLKKLREE